MITLIDPRDFTTGTTTGGIQEAVNYVESTGGGKVSLPPGNTTVKNTVTLTGSPAVTIEGCGPWASNVVLDSTFTDGDVFSVNSPVCLTMLRDFTIGGHAAHRSGFGIHLKGNSAGRPIVENVITFDLFGGAWVDGADYVTMRGLQVNQVANHNSKYGLKISGDSSSLVFDELFAYSPVSSRATSPTDDWHMDYGIWIESADGIQFSNPNIRANVGVYIQCPDGGQIGSVFFNQPVIDTCRSMAVVIEGIGTPKVLGNIHFVSPHIIANFEKFPGVVYNGNGVTGGVKFIGAVISGFKDDGFYSLNANNLTLDDCTIADNDGNGVTLLNGKNITLTANEIYDQRATPKQNYGIVLGGAIDKLNAEANTLYGNKSASLNNMAAMTQSSMRGNIGMEDTLGTLAVATTITLPSNGSRQIILTGNGMIKTINGAIGNNDQVSFFCPAGVVFSVGGNLANWLSPTYANQWVTAQFQGGSWFLR